LPTLSYVVILLGAVGIWLRTTFGLITVGQATILLLVIGIRNAWDLVIWMAQKPRT
jgi:hypothetical protein